MKFSLVLRGLLSASSVVGGILKNACTPSFATHDTLVPFVWADGHIFHHQRLSVSAGSCSSVMVMSSTKRIFRSIRQAIFYTLDEPSVALFVICDKKYSTSSRESHDFLLGTLELLYAHNSETSLQRIVDKYPTFEIGYFEVGSMSRKSTIYKDKEEHNEDFSAASTESEEEENIEIIPSKSASDQQESVDNSRPSLDDTNRIPPGVEALSKKTLDPPYNLAHQKESVMRKSIDGDSTFEDLDIVFDYNTFIPLIDPKQQ